MLSKKTILFCLAIISLTLAISLLLVPSNIRDALTGYAPSDSFSVTVLIYNVAYALNETTQPDSIIVGGENISISIPILYYENVLGNVSKEKPTGFSCGFDWVINESAELKTVADDGTYLYWLANQSQKNTTLEFNVPPPTLLNEVAISGDKYYQKDFEIYSCASLRNMSVVVSVGQGYQYKLYELENSTYIDKSTAYNLIVSSTNASFFGFDALNKTFRLYGSSSSQSNPSGGGGGGGNGGAIPRQSTANATNDTIKYDTKRKFMVEPNTITVNAFPGIREYNITIYNLASNQSEFSIRSTEPYIAVKDSTLTAAKLASNTTTVQIDSTHLPQGSYTGYIIVTQGSETETIEIKIELLDKAYFEKIIPKSSETQSPREVETKGFQSTILKNKERIIASCFLILFVVVNILLVTLINKRSLKKKEE